MSSPSTMSSTPLVSLPISLTSPRSLYVIDIFASHYTTILPDPVVDIWQKISGFLPKDDGLKHALTGTDVVVIPAGIPR